MQPGHRNLITDVPGLLVGQAEDWDIVTGVTVLTAAAPFVAAVHVMGGAPGTRETDLLAPDKLVTDIDALVLSGGSAFGLDAASGVTDALRAAGRGFRAGPAIVPIVPAAILFDLANGGAKDWAANPYGALGRTALAAAAPDFALGSAGAGAGATTGRLMGGVGSASAVLGSGLTVGALIAVNSHGDAIAGDGPHFWAAPWEFGNEFGGLGPATSTDPGRPARLKGETGGSGGGATAIGIVATDAALDKAQAQRMAIAAHDGLGRAIVPAHTPFDGDLIFAAATGARPLSDPLRDTLELGHAAACCLARACARAVFHAGARPGNPMPTWQERFGACDPAQPAHPV